MSTHPQPSIPPDNNNREVSPGVLAQTTSLDLSDNTTQPQAATSLDDDSRELICLVEKDSNVFQVQAPVNKNVMDLKKLIHEECKHGVLSNVDAKDLVLWKLKVSIAISPSRGLTKRIKEQGEVSNFAEELDEPIDKVLDIFPQQPSGNNLHIIAKLPATVSQKHLLSHATEENEHAAKRPRESRELLPDWLVELHEKLWGKGNLLHSIIRTVTLNKADYIQLQNELQHLHPSRGLDSYKSENVQQAKSAFLRSKNELSTETLASPETDPGYHQRATMGIASSSAVDHVMDVGGGDLVDPSKSKGDSPSGLSSEPTELDDDSELDDDATSIAADVLEAAPMIFPCKIRYLDLTVLELKYPPRVPILMQIRSGWDSMMQILQKCQKGVEGSIVITGQPGIGKTCFLYYCLVLRLVAAKHTVFQDKNGSVFNITDQVRKEGSVEGNDVLTLVDADGPMCIPDGAVLARTRYRILLTSSPRTDKDRKWMEQHCAITGQVLIMEPFSWEEMIQLALFILHFDIPFKRIRDAAQICGNIPGRCFDAAYSDGALEEAKKEIIQAIGNIQDVAKAVHDVHGDRLVPHHAFEIYPSAQSRRFSRCCVRPVSQWAFEQLMAEVERREQDGAYKFYKQIMGVDAAAAFRGRTWEWRVHQYFRSISTPTNFRMISLDDRADTIDITFSSQTLQETFPNKQNLAGRLAASVRDKTSCYLKPASTTFATVDSLFYDCKAHSGLNWLILCQMTDAFQHDMSTVGLARIQKSLKPKDQYLKTLRPSVLRRWIIAFVVPAPMGASFSKQKFKGDGASNWGSKTAQYVLELNIEEVFGVER